MSRGRPPEIRLWERVNKDGPTDYSAEDPCWIWMGKPSANGYGMISLGGRRGRVVGVHVFAYELQVGPVPMGYAVDHLCRVHLCVNGRHLEAVPQIENIMRGVGRPAQNARKTECPRGHPYTPENTYLRKNGWRQCRRCNRERRY